MARIRSIHPGIFTDEAFIAVSAFARLMFIGLLTEADDAGVFEWKPLRLKIRLFGADDVKADALLGELQQVNSVCQFEHDGKMYGAIRNFCKWQRPRAPEFVHPHEGVEDYVGLQVRTTREQTDRGTALGKVIAERDGSECRYCGNGVTPYRKKANSLEIDHIIPISRGGTDDIANLAAACKPCNQRKANMTEMEFLARFAKSELYEFSVSRIGKHNSQPPKDVSQDAKTQSAETRVQMEDGGWRMEDGIEGGKKERKEDSRQSAFDDQHDSRAVFDTWNALATDLKLSKAQHLSDQRKKAIRNRLSDLGGLEGWYACLDKIRSSKFLQGRTDNGFQITFDWLLKPANLTKVMEGNYDDRRPANTIQSAIDDLREGL